MPKVFGLEDNISILLCPLGNVPEDIAAWNASHSEVEDTTPGRYIPPEVRASYNLTRLICYLNKCLTRKETFKLLPLIKKACKAIGLGTSERQLRYYRQKLEQTGRFLIEKSRIGRSFVLFIRQKTPNYNRLNSKNSSCKSFYKSSKELNNNTLKQNTCSKTPIKTNLSTSLFRLAWFLARNFKKFHWIGCKIKFEPWRIIKSIHQTLKNGVDQELIVAIYQEALRKYHAIAVDRTEEFISSGIATAIYRLKPGQSVQEAIKSFENHLESNYHVPIAKPIEDPPEDKTHEILKNKTEQILNQKHDEIERTQPGDFLKTLKEAGFNFG